MAAASDCWMRFSDDFRCGMSPALSAAIATPDACLEREHGLGRLLPSILSWKQETRSPAAHAAMATARGKLPRRGEKPAPSVHRFGARRAERALETSSSPSRTPVVVPGGKGEGVGVAASISPLPFPLPLLLVLLTCTPAYFFLSSAAV